MNAELNAENEMHALAKMTLEETAEAEAFFAERETEFVNDLAADLV